MRPAPAPEPPEPTPVRTPRRGRWLAAFSWPVLVAWAGYVFVRAQRELTADLVVAGPERVWRAPYEVADGWVLDPRPGPLAAELRDRYRPGAPVPVADDPRATLAALGLATRDGRGLGDGLRPRVVFAPAGPLLVVGYADRDPVVFDPARGVVRLRAGTLGPDLPSLELTDALEAPW